MVETVKREVEFLNESPSLSEIWNFVKEVFETAEIGEPVSQVNNHICRARGVYAELVRNLVAEYSTGEEDFQEEMASVARFLEGGKYPGLPDSTAIQPRPGEDELAE
ncbi:MAG: hypothetical protein HY720_16930 [Planctomycetes bacterium]|nr:hypothetical protein [Planctomycetota bacterium]